MASFLPSEVGGRLFAYPVTSTTPVASGVIVRDSWQSLAVLVGWAVLVLAAGCVMVKRRDA